MRNSDTPDLLASSSSQQLQSSASLSDSAADRNTLTEMSSPTQTPAAKGNRPRSYSSRCKDNLMHASAFDNPYSPQAINAVVATTSTLAPINTNTNTSTAEMNAANTITELQAALNTNLKNKTEDALIADKGDQLDSYSDTSTDTAEGAGNGISPKTLSGKGIGSIKRQPDASIPMALPYVSPDSDVNNIIRADSAGSTSKMPGITRVRSHSSSGAATELARINTHGKYEPAKINTHGKSKNANALSDMYAQETLLLSSSAQLYNSFAFFCRVDCEPRRQRKILFAVNQRHVNVHHDKLESNRVLKRLDQSEVIGIIRKRGTSLGGFSGKLNSLLRNKKQNKTRSGIYHALSLSIQDFRIMEGLSMIEILSEATIQKKRTGDTNKALLHAMCNKLQTLSVSIMEKGYPSNPNHLVFASNEKFTFTFPSYFQLAVSLDLVEVARAMIKNRADVDVSWYQITPLMMAVLKGSHTMVTLLLEADANPSQRILLEDFLLLGRLKTSKASLRAAVRFPDIAGGGGTIPIMNLLGRGDGGNLLAENYRQFGQKGLVKFTTEYMEGKYVCLFEMAALRGHYKMASYLLGLTNQSLVVSSSFSLISSDSCKWSKQLIAAGVPLMQRDVAGSTCLHLAARRGDLDLVIVILEGGMDINVQGANGWTALHEAISMSHIQVFQYLLYKAADKKITNNSLDTPFDLAEKRGFDKDTLNLFFKEKGDLTLFANREKELASMERITFSDLFPNSLSKNKGGSGSFERSKFGGLFGTSASSSSISSVKSGKRSFFGRTSTSNSK